MLRYPFLTHIIVCLSALLTLTGTVFPLSDDKVLSLQNSFKDKTTGERISLFAEQFVGTPYDTDPLGTYVRQSVIVADEKVDCMYLTFRAVELALSSSPEEAIQTALEKRFHSKGTISNGKVVNYYDRFAYGEDMISSGKWGKEITAEIGRTVQIYSIRQHEDIPMLPRDEVMKRIAGLRSGDLLFFIKSPDEATADEIVGHIGIITKAGTTDKYVLLIHASGRKGKGGRVKKVLLSDYLRSMPFIGVKVTRFP
jgi:hypothetical protein